MDNLQGSGSNLTNYIGAGIATLVTTLLIVVIQAVQLTREDVIRLQEQIQGVGDKLEEKYDAHDDRINRIEESISRQKATPDVK